jgi:hypothetical protein
LDAWLDVLAQADLTVAEPRGPAVLHVDIGGAGASPALRVRQTGALPDLSASLQNLTVFLAGLVSALGISGSIQVGVTSAGAQFVRMRGGGQAWRSYAARPEARGHLLGELPRPSGTG